MRGRPKWAVAVAALLVGNGTQPPSSPVRRVAQGALLALGAPFGWLALRVAWLELDPLDEVLAHPWLYAYMTVATLLSYVLFSLRISASESRLLRANRDLSTLAVTDALTGLRNARFFQARIEEAAADSVRSGRPLSVVVLDLDHFKQVNDTHGHPVGDEVLQEVARRIHVCVRASDTAARVGGEEFALILPDTAEAGARSMAERVRHSICDDMVKTAAGALAVTISAGGAVLANQASHEALYAAADDALYRAKEAGRNQVVMSDDSVSE